jgi:UDP-glucose 4-epimerase
MCAALCAVAGNTGVQPVHEPARKVNPVSRRQAGVALAAERIGFRAAVGLELGLQRLVEWTRALTATPVEIQS